MKILNPADNLNRIISMIENAGKFVVIVSPYNDLTGWDHLIKAMNDAMKRNVMVHYYVRKGEGANGLEGLNVKLYEVPDLHAKMFFNEKEALISSGNLTSRPDINWVYLMTDKDEYRDITGFFEKYIKPVSKPLF